MVEIPSIADIQQRLNISDLLSAEDRLALTAALLAECTSRRLDHDRYATNAQIDAVHRWAARARFEYELTRRVIAMGRGVLAPDNTGTARPVVTTPVMEAVLVDLLLGSKTHDGNRGEGGD